ncbi:hypothetical protein GSI_15546 [Ganoderma sinense ZZ0214-1]|uniref:RlpA-like protein double-psi beta-barrel domain-containing protein n=1 Tax=Ganoderma sinense ZZ0214-1 TaxID=1077348 RepID=A0A2G8RMX2_9APHY|nr:hypothetical protein GSI_15546 [Ganoderma sinense ZZ0214-1]
MMSIFTLFVVAFALLASVLAAPIELEKRVTHTGRGTWFDVGLGACGDYNVNSDKIVAISSQVYGSGGNCNQWMHITNTANGKNAWGMVRDECPSCGAGDLDMSPSLFEELGSLDTGVLSISWHYENKDFVP